MKIKLIYFVLLLSAIFFGSRQDVKAQSEKKIRIVSDSVDVCDGYRRCVVIVDGGKFFYKDSILGYGITVKYNPNKVKFHSLAILGTVTGDSFDAGSVFGNFSQIGNVTVSAVSPFNFLRSSSDNQPLIAFIGDFQGSCRDTAFIDVSDFYFSRLTADDSIIDVYPDSLYRGVLRSRIEDKSSRHLKIGIKVQSLTFDNGVGQKLSFETFLMNYVSNNISEIVFSANVSGQSVEIDSVESINKDVKITSISPDRKEVHCQINSNANVEVNFLKFTLRGKKNENYQDSLVLIPIQVNSCACVTKMLESRLDLTGKKVISMVEEDTASLHNARIEEIDGMFLVWSNKEITSFEVYTNLGVLVSREIFSPSKFFAINRNIIYSNGLYWIVLRSAEKEILVKKILKYNNY